MSAAWYRDATSTAPTSISAPPGPASWRSRPGFISRASQNPLASDRPRPSWPVPCIHDRPTGDPLRELVGAHRDEIKAIVARHHGRSVAIFGSVARGDERPGSDIDFLVELAPGTRPFVILSIGAELEEALGVKVDVGTPDSLRDRLRDEVLAEAVPL